MALYLPLCIATWHKGEWEARGRPPFSPGEVVELPVDAKALVDEAINYTLRRLEAESVPQDAIACLALLERIIVVFGLAAIVDCHDALLEQVRACDALGLECHERSCCFGY